MSEFALLEAAIAATNSRSAAEVVAEHHDASKINVGASASAGRPSDGLRRQLDSLKGNGFWDEAEYGISRAAQIAKLEESLAKAVTYEQSPEGIEAARVEAERALSEMRQRALRRASLDTTGGRVAVMVAGQPAWHGLGVNVREAVTSAEAVRLAGLNWTVRKTQLQYRNPVTGEMDDAIDQFGIVREDSGKMLGAVGKVYQPFQNAEGFEFLDLVIGEFGARYETAGALYGGSKVWMQVHLPQQAFSVNGSDKIEPYCIFTNSHDGSEAARCFPTSHRVVCANTMRLAKGADMKKGIVMRHTSNLKQRVAAAQSALGIAVKQVDRYRESAELLCRKKVEPIPYFDGLLDIVCDITKADATKGADVLAAAIAMTEADRSIEAARIQRQIDKRHSHLDDLWTRYESEKNGLGGMRGTGWAALNAVTESANHGNLAGRVTGDAATKRSRRFESVINGAADEVMQVAFEQVMQLAS